MEVVMTKSKHVVSLMERPWLAAALLCVPTALACQASSQAPKADAESAASGVSGSRALASAQPTAAGAAGHAREGDAAQAGASAGGTSSAAGGGVAVVATPSAGASAAAGVSAGGAAGAALAPSAGASATPAASAPTPIGSACGAADSFVRGARIELNIVWPGTVALAAGSGKVTAARSRTTSACCR
jgi:hypothetical protein